MIRCMCAQSLSCVQLLVDLWTVARQTPLSMGFPRQEYWSGMPFSSLEDLPDPEIKPRSPAHCRQFLHHVSHQGSLLFHLRRAELGFLSLSK